MVRFRFQDLEIWQTAIAIADNYLILQICLRIKSYIVSQNSYAVL